MVAKVTPAVQAQIDAAVTSATEGLVVAVSKPDSIKALSATWRKSAEHLAQQVQRFVRLTILAAIPSIYNVIAGGKFDWKTLLTFVLPFAEVAYRQVFPSMDAAAVDSAPGATIVPDQVGAAVAGPAPDGATVQVGTDSGPTT